MTTIKQQIEKEIMDQVTITKIEDGFITFYIAGNEFFGKVTKSGKYKKNSMRLVCY